MPVPDPPATHLKEELVYFAPDVLDNCIAVG